MQKNCEIHQDICVIFPMIGRPELSIFLKKYTINQNNEGKDFVIKDFVLGRAQKMKESAQTEDDKDRGINH